MGKTKKSRTVISSRNNPLDQQLIEDSLPKPSGRVKIRNRQEEKEFVDEKLSKKILKQARLQQDELEEENEGGHKRKHKIAPHHLQLTESGEQSDEDDDLSVASDHDLVNIEVNEDDAKALEVFMSADPYKKATLADIIKEKITEKHTEIETQFSDAGTIKSEHLERLKPIYEGVAKVLSQYRSGKLPKAFKTLPMLSNWEQILCITNPDGWTAAAVYQATRIFASNLKENMAQKFYNLMLLPRLRDDIADTKVLNFHLYQALKKAAFKPGALFKGIILPLCASGNCTLREATIFGSVLAKCSLPVLHSSAAIMKIAEMDYNGANSIFLRVLLEKQYALPFRVIDAVVAHFLRFALDKRELPLLWHQCLLTFVQLYKNDMSGEQKDALQNLLTVHKHKHVTPEIHRELMNSVARSSTATTEESMNVT